MHIWVHKLYIDIFSISEYLSWTTVHKTKNSYCNYVTFRKLFPIYYKMQMSLINNINLNNFIKPYFLSLLVSALLSSKFSLSVWKSRQLWAFKNHVSDVNSQKIFLKKQWFRKISLTFIRLESFLDFSEKLLFKKKKNNNLQQTFSRTWQSFDWGKIDSLKFEWSDMRWICCGSLLYPRKDF